MFKSLNATSYRHLKSNMFQLQAYKEQVSKILKLKVTVLKKGI